MLPQGQQLDEMDESMWDLTGAELGRTLSYFGAYDVTELELLRTHALHLAGHRFQIRYVRGTYSRAHGTRKADFDPW